MLVKCSFSPKRPGRLSQFLLTRSRPFVGKLAVNSITQKADTAVYLCVNRNHMSFCTFHSNNSCICNICDARGSVYKGDCSPYPRKKGSFLSSNTLMDLLSSQDQRRDRLFRLVWCCSEYLRKECKAHLARLPQKIGCTAQTPRLVCRCNISSRRKEFLLLSIDRKLCSQLGLLYGKSWCLQERTFHSNWDFDTHGKHILQLSTSQMNDCTQKLEE